MSGFAKWWAAAAVGAATLVALCLGWLILRTDRKPNVVLISVDTLRADRVGVADRARATTPVIDRLAASGFNFRRAYAPSNHTLPSHMSILTGLYPRTHGVVPGSGKKREIGIQPLAKERVTLGEILQSHGYVAGGFAFDCIWLRRQYGFSQGFDRYMTRPHDAAQMNEREIFPWLAAHREQPFFLFVHYYDVHSDWKKLPYDAPEDLRAKHAGGYSGNFDGCGGDTCATRHLMRLDAERTELPEEDLRYIASLYDAGVEATDRAVGQLLDRIDNLGLSDSTLVVVVSDHGEELRDHGRFVHTQLYDEVIAVPMVFSLPSSIPAGAGSDQPVSLLDVTPTILDLLGIESRVAMDGRSLLPLIRERHLDAVPLFFSSRHQRGVIDWPWKLIRSKGRIELYDLASDPLERNDASRGAAAEVERLDAMLKTWHAVAPRDDTGAPGAIEPNPADIERLRALGYVN